MKTSNKTKPESLEFYLRLKYPITIYPDDDGGYVSEIKGLPGCFTQGETIEETLANIDDARQLWLETAYEYGDHIPLPANSKMKRINYL